MTAGAVHDTRENLQTKQDFNAVRAQGDSQPWQ